MTAAGCEGTAPAGGRRRRGFSLRAGEPRRLAGREKEDGLTCHSGLRAAMALGAAAPLRSVGSGECGGAGAAPAGRARGGPGPAPPPTRWRPPPSHPPFSPQGPGAMAAPGRRGTQPAGPPGERGGFPALRRGSILPRRGSISLQRGSAPRGASSGRVPPQPPGKWRSPGVTAGGPQPWPSLGFGLLFCLVFFLRKNSAFIIGE